MLNDPGRLLAVHIIDLPVVALTSGAFHHTETECSATFAWRGSSLTNAREPLPCLRSWLSWLQSFALGLWYTWRFDHPLSTETVNRWRGDRMSAQHLDLQIDRLGLAATVYTVARPLISVRWSPHSSRGGSLVSSACSGAQRSGTPARSTHGSHWSSSWLGWIHVDLRSREVRSHGSTVQPNVAPGHVRDALPG